MSPNLKGEDKLRLISFASLAIGGGDLFGEGIDPIATKFWHFITGTQVAIASRGTVTPITTANKSPSARPGLSHESRCATRG
jgi:hypothetical protein